MFTNCDRAALAQRNLEKRVDRTLCVELIQTIMQKAEVPRSSEGIAIIWTKNPLLPLCIITQWFMESMNVSHSFHDAILIVERLVFISVF